MKQILSSLIFIFATFFFCYSQNLAHHIEQNSMNRFEMTFHQPSFTVAEIKTDQGYFSKIEIPNFHKSNQVGAPEIPVLVKMIEIPLCENAVLKVTPGNFEIVDAEFYGINYPLFPVQKSYAKSHTGPFDFQKDKAIYNSNQFYGNDLVTMEIEGILRNTRLATLHFSPIQYNPVTNQLKIYRSAKVEIVYENVDVPATLEMKTLHGNGLFYGAASQVINPLTTKATRSPVNSVPIKYLIVAHAMFRNTFDDFIAWKKEKGFLVEVAYTDDENVGTSSSDIQRFIKSKYTSAKAEDPAPSYVLLMGDIQQIPAFTRGSHVTDLYYFTWTDGDNIPDCYYGRMSAQTVEQLEAQIAKTLKYEQFLFDNPAHLGRAVLIAGTDSYWSSTHANGQVNYLSNNYINQDYGYTNVYKHLYNCSSQAAQIRSELSGGTGFANYTAHCTEKGWGDPSFSINHVESMTNTDMYGLMIGNCCLSSKFDETVCFAEAITRIPGKGAVAYIGGTDNTYWDEDYYWSMGVRASTVPNPSYNADNLGVFDRLFHTHGEDFSEWYTTCGAIITAGNLSVQSSTSHRKSYYWEIYTLMGDPSLMPYLAIPKNMAVNAPDFISMGSSSLTINAVPHAYVALLQDGELLCALFADEYGIADLNFNPINNPKELTLSISAQNHIHYSHTIEPMTADGIYIHAEEVSLFGTDTLTISHQGGWNITAKNIGATDAQQVYVKISSESEYASLFNDSAYIGDMAAGQTIFLENIFDMKILNFATGQRTIPFTITFYDNNGTISHKRVKYNVFAPTRIDYPTYEPHINIYPNPTDNHITISGEIAIRSIEIIDLHGKLVKSVSGNGNSQEQISVSELANGFYLIRITSEKQEVIVRKFSKQ
ncbi:C25 family cysteine peptidase [Bacteroidales bacterium OttesenSCG-928-B11]|nr:C25 family cysteine peptidase [Bacteroidales bacterium OttesenSCG-928-E04]MDL2308775.1 C25 family cysteine peptidase [Bacteroidales bacterium OttesenSCG-928-C03]MDL2312658.1 C25 family cysteine peptidase [Bacteroidales bacterium OttesenSCG-928-B11]MDL2326091.1 C25 family cysteine peptidase [Bacteroidales bacterium OttesenSCG-928-A14]